MTQDNKSTWITIKQEAYVSCVLNNERVQRRKMKTYRSRRQRHVRCRTWACRHVSGTSKTCHSGTKALFSLIWKKKKSSTLFFFLLFISRIFSDIDDVIDIWCFHVIKLIDNKRDVNPLKNCVRIDYYAS